MLSTVPSNRATILGWTPSQQPLIDRDRSAEPPLTRRQLRHGLGHEQVTVVRPGARGVAIRIGATRLAIG